MWVVKAQVHAGGRGKAGGVKLVKTKDEIEAFADAVARASNLVTYQTDEKGQPVSKILVESCTDIAEELYLGAVVDRARAASCSWLPPKAAWKSRRSPKRRRRRSCSATIDPLVGAQPYQGRELAFKLGLKGDQIKQFVKIFMGLAQAVPSTRTLR